MHYTDEGGWEDRTISSNTSANTVTGLLDSLSPVVPAVVSDGTFGPIYFEAHPLSKIADIVVSSNNSSDKLNAPITILATEGNIHPGDQLKIINIIQNLQRSSQQYDYVIEVFDADKIVIELITRSGTLDAGKSIEISQDWSAPKQSGEYTVKIIVIRGLYSPLPMLLKNSTSEGISVIA